MALPTTYVTTSWDDGHELDLVLASELAAHGLTGTFYVAPLCRGIPPVKRLTNGGLGELADGFEIGGHTLTHPHLSHLSPADARREILDGKVALEDRIGCPVTSFCYPYGDYGKEHPNIVREAGFTLARTVERFCTTEPHDLFQMGTTIHAYRHLVDGPQIPHGALDRFAVQLACGATGTPRQATLRGDPRQGRRVSSLGTQLGG